MSGFFTVTSQAGAVTGPPGAPGPGVAINGFTGQILVKLSNVDYDTAWEDLPPGGAVGSVALPLMDGIAAPGTASPYTREDHVHPTDTTRVAKAGDSMTGALILNGNPTALLQAATKNYVDTALLNRVAKAGDTMTGDLVLVATAPRASPAGDLDAVPRSWVATNYLALTGGALTGPVTLPLDPVTNNELANKHYVDAAVATANLWQGTYAVSTNTPDLSAITPLDGYSWTATTVDATIAEPLTIALPGLPLGTMINANDVLKFSGGLWYLLAGASITKGLADATYVALAGSTMTGPLILSADPTVALGAATKQYVDARGATVADVAPATPIQGALWFDSTNLLLYVFYDDGSSKQWVPTTQAGSAASIVPLDALMSRIVALETEVHNLRLGVGAI